MLVFLFILQIISFYFIALLYTKLSKFQDLERKQESLMNEMENSFSAYIAEMKDENDRLLAELGKETNSQSPKRTIDVQSNHEAKQPIPKTFVSKQLAASTYTQMKQTPKMTEPESTQEKVLYYQDKGMSIDEIAKFLQIGKTEVELFLKFRE